MNYTKTLMVAAALMGTSTIAARADDIQLSFIMCGDVRPADQATDLVGVVTNLRRSLGLSVDLLCNFADAQREIDGRG